MDQCKHCTLRGDLVECKKESCSHHENWYAIEQQDRIDELESALKAISAQEGDTATGAFAECELRRNRYKINLDISVNMKDKEG